MARGGVYRPTYKGSDGKLKKQAVYWLVYYQNGKKHRESTGTTVRGEADQKLRDRMKAVDEGAPPEPSKPVTVATLQKLVENDYSTNGRKSSRNVTAAFSHLVDYFGDREAKAITVAAVEAYRAHRQEQGAKPATVNRELAQLRRGYRLAIKGELLSRRPAFSLAAEHNRRRGFFEVDQFEAVMPKLPEHLQPLMRFLYWTGWRSAEARGLEWRQVDRKAGVVRIEDTKSGEPRTIPYKALPALHEVIEAQWKRRAALMREAATQDGKRKRLARIVPFVFCTPRGHRITDYSTAWAEACTKAGLPGRIVHDFRRTAARNMLRAGIPQAVAMLIAGWKTDSVFRRYAIVDERLIAENLKKLVAQ